jgi:hypothetical protein
VHIQRVKSSGTNLRQRFNDRGEAIARRIGAFLGTPLLPTAAFHAFMFRLAATHLHVFVVTTVALAFITDHLHDRRAQSTVRTGRTVVARRNRFKKAGKKLPLTRAVFAQTGLTTKQRRQAWLTTTCERIGVVPRVTYLSMRNDDAGNELWDVRVPITPSMNPSVLARPHYEAGFKGCVKGACFGVTINASTERGGVAHIYITRTDITSIVAGPAPILERYPASIAEPVQIGITAVRKPRHLDLIERNGIGIFGMPGTGKSTLLHTIIAQCVAAPDATVYLADLKDGIDGEAWEGSTIYTESVLVVREWISRYARPNGSTFTYSDYATSRARHLKKLGIRKWEKGCGLNAEFIIIDEIDNLTKQDQAAFAWMTTKLRAIGVRPIIATQLPRADTLDPRLSTALNVRIAFAVDNVDAANVALGKGAVGRGYDPSILPMPGYCLVKDAQERDPSMVRTHMLEPVHVERISKAFPLELAEQSGAASESDATRTVQGGAMEGPPGSDRPVSDPEPLEGLEPVPPPADALADPKRMALWDAMPGRVGVLCERSGYGKSQATVILNQWRAERKAWQVGQVWHHRGAVTQPRSVA